MIRRHRHPRTRTGSTLLETMIALVILSMLMMGTMDLYINSGRFATRTQAETNATFDATVAIHQILETAHEAHWLALPGETAPTSGSALFTARPGYTAITNYQTTVGTSTIDTAMEFTLPAVRTGSAQFTVNKSSGSVTMTGVYDRNNDGIVVLIYRSDKTGVPTPSNGAYLWEYSITDSGASYNRPLIKSIANVPNGVQFARPVDSSGSILPFQLQMKIVSGYYSPVNGMQTNEETNGQYTSQLTGMCVLMRDHELDGSHEPNVSKPGDNVGIGNHWINN